MIVTIDGPAGVGKSTVARELAARLGFQFLNTGAMYRAVTVVCLRRGIDLSNAAAVAECARRTTLEFRGEQVLANGEDVTAEIGTEPVREKLSFVTDNPAVREHLVALQRRMVAEANFVAEGRDQGTVAFPNAECKFFLTADPRERATRRLRQLEDRGETVSLDDILREQSARDLRDETRPVGPLRKADDALTVDTTRLNIDQVLDHMEQAVRERCS